MYSSLTLIHAQIKKTKYIVAFLSITRLQPRYNIRVHEKHKWFVAKQPYICRALIQKRLDNIEGVCIVASLYVYYSRCK